MVARNGFPSAVKRLNLVVTRLGLVYFFILEVVVFGLVPVDLWTVLCVAAGFEIVGASCKGVVVAGLGGDILESVLEDGGTVGICFSGVTDVAKVRAGGTTIMLNSVKLSWISLSRISFS